MLQPDEWQKINDRHEKLSSFYSDQRSIPYTDFTWQIRQIDPEEIFNSNETVLLLQEYLAYWEKLADSVNSGAVDLSLLDKTFPQTAQSAYKDVARYIRHCKRGEDCEHLYNQLDKFIDTLLLNNLSKLPAKNRLSQHESLISAPPETTQEVIFEYVYDIEKFLMNLLSYTKTLRKLRGFIHQAMT